MEKLKELVISFFKRAGAICREEGEYVIVESVDDKFKEVYKKPPPYKISFSERDKDRFDVDCFFPGSKLFNVIMGTLNQNASTTILKINLKVDPMEEISKRVSLKNCLLKDLKKDYENNFFSRFTFRTSIRYLNKNEEIFHEIFVHNNKIVMGDLEDYDISSGELQEVDTKYMEKDYNIAREEIKLLTKPKIQEISGEISEKLDNEIQRIKKHYESQKAEILAVRDRLLQRLEETNREENSSEKEEKIQRIKKQIGSSNLEEQIENLVKEEEFTIKDERQKHAISLDTKLTNTTVLYYPKYKLNLFLVDGQINKEFQIGYDPLLNKMEEINCFSCNKEMKELALCATGHVCCPSCLFRCASCGKQFCEKCLKEKCNSCGGPVCDSCKRTCKKCKRIYCKQHIREDAFSGEEYCLDCMGFCSECSRSILGENLKEISPGRKICLVCEARIKKNKVLGDIFKE